MDIFKINRSKKNNQNCFDYLNDVIKVIETEIF